MISNCPLLAQIFKRSVLSDTGMSHTLASQLFYSFIILFLLFVVEKTSMYDILQYPTRLHTTLSYN